MRPGAGVARPRLREGAAEYAKANLDVGSARKRFYTAARDELGIASGGIPDLSQPPTWQVPEPKSNDA